MKTRGRPRICFPYELARDIIRAEMLKSAGEYRKWWEFNRPARMPKNPQRAYHKVWKGWGDFLGSSNPFPCVRKKFRSFKDARAYAHSLNVINRAQWFEHCKRPDFPEDVCKRPDVYFQKTLEWISWRDFLGYKVADKIAAIGTTDHIILITRSPYGPGNVYNVGLTTLGKDAIQNHLREHSLVLVAAFYHDKKTEWVPLVRPYMTPYGEGAFIINNVGNILNVLSLNFLGVRW